MKFFTYVKYIKIIKIFNILFFLLLIPFSSCSHKKLNLNIVKRFDNNIFISMPKNVIVFDNLSPILYKHLIDIFKSKRYNLVYSNIDTYHLKVKIKKLFPEYKFISPDMLLYTTKVGFELECKLFDNKKNLIVKKDFLFSKLINKPKNPLLNSSFLNYQYNKIMKLAAAKIEGYIRKSILK